MIFVTVGHQMPFDRLVRLVDDWAGRVDRSDLFAQVGETDHRPAHFQASRFLTPPEFGRHMREASAIVAHAGTGTILAALELGKPLLVLPRRSSLGETRNDHQLGTARHFADKGYILAGYDDDEFVAHLDRLERFRPPATINGKASPELLKRLRDFAFGSDGATERRSDEATKGAEAEASGPPSLRGRGLGGG